MIRFILRCCALVLVFQVVLPDLRASSPEEFWPAGAPIEKVTPPELSAQDSTLQLAIRFQQLYQKIRSGEKSTVWRSELETLTTLSAKDPMSLGIREVALVWQARVEMEEIDILLLDFYRHKIRFPRTDQEFQSLLPPNLAKDPWGNPWTYSSRAPEGFSHLEDQRYQLEPSTWPNLSPLSAAVKSEDENPFRATIVPREIAGRKALEFHSPQSVSVIEAGGKSDHFTLLFIGDHWVLMEGLDRIFAVPF